MDVLGSEQRLVKFVQGNIYFDYIELLMLNEVPDDQIKGTAVGQSVARPANQISGVFQIQLQGKCQGNGGLLGRLGIRVVDQLGKMLLGDVGFFVDGGILQLFFLNQFQQSLGKD